MGMHDADWKLAAITGLAAVALSGCATRASGPMPLQPLHQFFSNEDYPAAALRYEQQGRTTVMLDIGENGRAFGCRVTTSSGSAALDSTTCRLLRSRSRFKPAQDRRGRPVAGSFATSISWTLPDA